MTSNMPNRQLVGLSRHDTLPAGDFVWMKPPCVPGLPTPILPCNEPSISSYIMFVVDNVDSNIPHSTPCSVPQTIQPAECNIQAISTAPSYIMDNIDSIVPHLTSHSVLQSIQPADCNIQVISAAPTSVAPALGLQVSIFCTFNFVCPLMRFTSPVYHRICQHPCHLAWTTMSNLNRLTIPLFNFVIIYKLWLTSSV